MTDTFYVTETELHARLLIIFAEGKKTRITIWPRQKLNKNALSCSKVIKKKSNESENSRNIEVVTH